jgi:hypothetical protein
MRQEECKGLIEDDTQYHNDHGRNVVDVEAGEICAKCEGEGQISAGNGGLVICQTCGGYLGPITPFVHLENGSPRVRCDRSNR